MTEEVVIEVVVRDVVELVMLLETVEDDVVDVVVV